MTPELNAFYKGMIKGLETFTNIDYEFIQENKETND